VRFYERREVKDVIAYLRLIQNPVDTVSLRRVLNVPARGIGAVSLQRLEAHAEAENLSLFETLRVADDIGGLTPRVRAGIREFVGIVDLLHGYREKLSVTALVSELIDQTGYVKELRAERTLEAQTRIENVEELITVTKEYDSQPESSLTGFLEHLALMSDVDSYQESPDAVTLMTLHAAKGLEFPCVFLVGLEENILPHVRSIHGDQEALEEERRLCYVGITRAQEELVLTHTSRRSLFGSIQLNRPSRFLSEIPEELLEAVGPSSGRRSSGARATESSRWETPRTPFDPRRRDAQGSSLRSLDVHGLVDKLRAQKGGQFKPGDRVRHPTFGQGIVTKSLGSGEDEQVSAVFPGQGEKKLLVAFAKLERVVES
jgi:DNA helicase-2/ATP-dependent DNA helicase PcrA